MKDLIERIENEIESLLEAPSNPVDRTRVRMDDAAKRKGLGGMMKALTQRVKATEDRSKLIGISDYLDVLIKELKVAQGAALAKVKRL